MVKNFHKNNATDKIILSVVFIFSFLTVFAQSKHVSKLNLGNYSLDFNSEPVVTELPYKYLGDLLYRFIRYVDDNGKVKLTANFWNNIILDENLEPIKGCEKFGEYIRVDGDNHLNFFVPNPCNENLVYYFDWDRYFIIDLNLNEIVSDDVVWLHNLNSFFSTGELTPVLVHHKDNKNIWLIYVGDSKYYQFLITANGVEEKEIVELDPKRYNFDISKDCKWSINMSRDCKYYSAFSQKLNHNTVYFGEFDRENGIFKPICNYTFKKYWEIYSSVFSPDGKRIFYIGAASNGIIEIISVDIKNGIPDYESSENSKPYYTKKERGINIANSCYYGLDGNIYIAYKGKREIAIIPFDKSGNLQPYMPEFKKTERVIWTRLTLVSTWFSDDYRQAVCTPKISAENSCFGDRTDFSVINFSGVKTFLWNFGDGETSTEISPSHLYKKSGSYKVKLLIDGKDEYETDIEIYPQPKSPKVIETQ
jgi:hypothetical protein